MSPREEIAGVARLAGWARDGLRADAAMVVMRSAGAPVVIDAQGAQDLQASRLATLLLRLDERLDGGRARPLTDMADDGLDVVSALAREGFGCGVVAPLTAELEGRLGSVFVLRAEPRPFANPQQLEGFARSVVLALGRHREGEPASLAERLHQLESLEERVLGVMSFEELSAALDATVAPLVGATTTGIVVFDEQREVLQLLPGSFGVDEQTAVSYLVAVHDPRSNAARVFRTGRPYISNQAPSDPAHMQDYIEAFGIQRVMTVPLGVSHRPIGVLHLANKDAEFTSADLERILALAPRIGSAVETGRTLLRLRRREELKGIVSGVAVAIASGAGVNDFLKTALRELGHATDARLVAVVVVGSDPVVWRRNGSLPELEEALLREAADEPGVRSQTVGPQRAGDPGSTTLYVPLWLGRQRVGTLVGHRFRGEPFAQDERDAFSQLANLTALGWATERYQQQRAELARLHERQRIADDLHDDVAQILFAAQLSLDSVLEQHDLGAPVADAIERARGLLVRGDAAIRTVIHRLSRPAPADLPSRLFTIVSDVENEFGLPIHVEVSDKAAEAGGALRKPAADALLKVAREALVNAAKHAGPCRATVTLQLTRRGRLQLLVIDDGIGLRAAHSHRHGHGSLRRTVQEQGGWLRIQPGLSGGTKVAVSLPLDG